MTSDDEDVAQGLQQKEEVRGAKRLDPLSLRPAPPYLIDPLPFGPSRSYSLQDRSMVDDLIISPA
jgi:hypothetical protein